MGNDRNIWLMRRIYPAVLQVPAPAAYLSPKQHQNRWASGLSSSHHMLLIILVTLIEFGGCSPQICPMSHFSCFKDFPGRSDGSSRSFYPSLDSGQFNSSEGSSARHWGNKTRLPSPWPCPWARWSGSEAWTLGN